MPPALATLAFTLPNWPLARWLAVLSIFALCITLSLAIWRHPDPD